MTQFGTPKLPIQNFPIHPTILKALITEFCRSEIIISYIEVTAFVQKKFLIKEIALKCKCLFEMHSL